MDNIIQSEAPKPPQIYYVDVPVIGTDKWTTVTIARRDSQGITKFGVAICSLLDQFVRSKGRLKAIGRLDAKLSAEQELRIKTVPDTVTKWQFAKLPGFLTDEHNDAIAWVLSLIEQDICRFYDGGPDKLWWKAGACEQWRFRSVSNKLKREQAV